MASPRNVPRNSVHTVLAAGEKLACERGYNGFSYADVAARLGVTKACLHYHFAAKADLGLALMRRHRERRAALLAAIAAAANAAAGTRLRRYGELYSGAFAPSCAGLRGIFAAESYTLPAAMRREIRLGFREELRWLTALLADGRRRRQLRFDGTAGERAERLLAELEGAVLLARARGNDRELAVAVGRAIRDLG